MASVADVGRRASRRTMECVRAISGSTMGRIDRRGRSVTGWNCAAWEIVAASPAVTMERIVSWLSCS